MMMKILFFLLLGSFIYASENPLTIAFGSCNNQNLDQSHWQHIASHKPAAWVWLGDTIYADNMGPKARWAEYEKILQDPNYAKLRESTWITGLWDDHDFAHNGAGRDEGQPEVSKELFLDFLELPRSESVWERPGIYRSYEMSHLGKTVKLILLDTRSFKENPGTNNDLLGSAQWEWLEKELKEEASLFIIGSGINISSPVNFRNLLEGWMQYPSERRKLFTMLKKLKAPALLISGDRHSADFARVPLGRNKKVIEFMSSGLTHTRFAIPNPHRIKRAYSKPNFGLIHVDFEKDSVNINLEIRNSKDNEMVRTLNLDY